MSVVTVHDLTKTYGDIRAVHRFGLSADRGEIVAVVGPDGAGKTSLFRSACGLLAFDSGEVRIAGLDVRTEPEKIKAILGYMPQAFSLYADLSVEENLRFYSGLFGQNRRRFLEQRDRLYAFSGLGPFSGRRAGALSGGMKQKLALSCALVHDPTVLVLDEPTTGVDPLSRRQFWDILKGLKKDGATIVVSTPYMDEVALADRAIFIYEGRKIAEGTPAELPRKFRGQVFRIRLAPTVALMDRLRALPDLEARRFGSSVHVYSGRDETLARMRERLGELGIAPSAVEPTSPELEDTFIQLMGSR